MRRAGLLLLIVLVGCSGRKDKLDEKTAADGIGPYLKGNASRFSVTIGRVGTQCPNKDVNGDEILDYLDPGISIETHLLEIAGYVTEAPDGPGFWKLSLTDQGKAAAAANQSRNYAVPPGKGCDYQVVFFTLATSELVKVTSIVPGEGSTKVNYLYRWNLTDLGQMFRADGKLYSMLDKEQRDSLRKMIQPRIHPVPFPLPPDSYTDSSSMQVKKFPQGWQMI
jgi:hypothetical protein